MLRQLALLLHLLAAMAWIGGMFFAYFCLRPAAAEVLQPPQRLPLWTATFARFLPYIALAVVLLLASGLGMLLQVGFRNAPAGWHVMFTLGLVMAALFVYVYAVLYPKLRAHCAASAWPAAGQTLNRIRTEMVGRQGVVVERTVAGTALLSVTAMAKGLVGEKKKRLGSLGPRAL